VQQLAKIDQVRQLVPQSALYVTVSAVGITQDSQVLAEKTHYFSAASTAEWAKVPTEASYMLHDGQNLKVISVQGERLSVPLTDITTLYRYLQGGFVLALRSGQCIFTSTPTPVQTAPDMQFRTDNHMTDMTGGWLQELQPFSVQVVD
jgi:hypothetical protein